MPLVVGQVINSSARPGGVVAGLLRDFFQDVQVIPPCLVGANGGVLLRHRVPRDGGQDLEERAEPLLVLSISSVDRRWPNHVPISGPVNGFAMTEQLRVISRARIGDTLGQVSAETMDGVRTLLGDFLALAPNPKRD